MKQNVQLQSDFRQQKNDDFINYIHKTFCCFNFTFFRSTLLFAYFFFSNISLHKSKTKHHFIDILYKVLLFFFSIDLIYPYTTLTCYCVWSRFFCCLWNRRIFNQFYIFCSHSFNSLAKYNNSITQVDALSTFHLPPNNSVSSKVSKGTVNSFTWTIEFIKSTAIIAFMFLVSSLILLVLYLCRQECDAPSNTINNCVDMSKRKFRHHPPICRDNNTYKKLVEEWVF